MYSNPGLKHMNFKKIGENAKVLLIKYIRFFLGVFQYFQVKESPNIGQIHNLGQKFVDKSTKFCNFYTEKCHNLTFGRPAGYSPSYPSILRIFLKFIFWKVLSRSSTRDVTRTFTFWS